MCGEAGVVEFAPNEQVTNFFGGKNGHEIEDVNGKYAESEGVGVKPHFSVVRTNYTQMVKHKSIEAVHVKPDAPCVRFSFGVVSVGCKRRAPVSAAFVDVEGIDFGADFLEHRIC